MTLKTSFVLVAGLAAGTAFADPRPYLQVELDVPAAGSLGTSIYDINDDGIMVGNFANGDVVDAFVHQDGAFTDIVAPGASGWSELLGINRRGFAVGDFVDAAGVFHGFTRAPDGTMTVLPDPIDNLAVSELNGVNDEGVIVGAASTDQNFVTCVGFIHRDGQYQLVQHAGAVCTWPTGINDRGQIVGYWTDAANVRHAFVLELGDDINRAREIDVGQNRTRPYHISNRGVVAGWYIDSQHAVHGYYQRLGGEAHTLDFPGASDTVLLGVNDSDILVGSFNGFSGGLLAIPLDR